MASTPELGAIRIGDWLLQPASGELSNAALQPPREAKRIEPKMVELLQLLASQPGAVLSREEITTQLWPQTVVGDDALARTVSKLRKALGDDGKQQHYIETLSKRGYRLIAPVSGPDNAASRIASMPTALLTDNESATTASTATTDTTTVAHAPIHTPTHITSTVQPTRQRFAALTGLVAIAVVTVVAVGLLRYNYRAPPGEVPASTQSAATADAQHAVARANDFYFQFSRPGNESAIALFEQLLARKPDYAPGYAGLANALVQKVIRWQRPPENGIATPADFTRLGDAIANGHTRTDAALALLDRAEQLALQAVALAPRDAESLKALGFVYSAQEKFALALATYQRAIHADPDAWGALINMGDVLEITGHSTEALTYFEAAHTAMARVYAQQSARVLPWYSTLGVAIGDRYRSRGDSNKAEQWYRRVLDDAPLHPVATGRIAQIRWQAGDRDAARTLCSELRLRVGETGDCEMPANP